VFFGGTLADCSVPNASKRQSLVKRKAPAEEVAEESRSSQVTVAADMVFSMSKNLSGVSALMVAFADVYSLPLLTLSKH
jgi:hypothetical protein